MTDRLGNKMAILLAILVLGTLTYYLSPILTPFLIGAIFAYLCDPVVEWLTGFKIPRTLSVVIVFTTLFIFIILLLILLVPPIQTQVIALINQIPSMLNDIEEKLLPWVSAHFGIDLKESLPKFENLRSENVVQASSSLLKSMLQSGITIFEVLLNMVLIPVVTFYFLRDWDYIIQNIQTLIPKRAEPSVKKIAKECDTVLSAFLRGQLLVMLSLGIFYAIALSFIGLQYGMTIGLVIGLISIVPYLGMIVGVCVATITALTQFGTFTSVLWVLLIFLIGHGLENAYLSPKLIGDRVGLHPITVIFAILAGGKLFGFFGVLLALPVAAIIMVLIRHLLGRYRKSEWYK